MHEYESLASDICKLVLLKFLQSAHHAFSNVSKFSIKKGKYEDNE